MDGRKSKRFASLLVLVFAHGPVREKTEELAASITFEQGKTLTGMSETQSKEASRRAHRR